MNTMEIRIRAKCQEIADLLAAKNASYGDSALNPIRIFSQADARAGLAVRIDDKLSRIKNQPGAFGEDPVNDLVGYLVLWLIMEDTISFAGSASSRENNPASRQGAKDAKKPETGGEKTPPHVGGHKQEVKP